MSTFLQFVGGLVLAVGSVLLIVVAVMVFRWRKALRNAIKMAALSGASITPSRITLVRADDIAFGDRERFEADRDALRAAGYREIGAFHIREMPIVRLAALHHRQRHAFAVLYDHDLAGPFCDLFMPLPDDGGLTVSSAPSGGELDPIPGRIKCPMPGRPVAELLARFETDSAGREPRRVPVDGFAAEFEGSYAREMDWRNSRGGPTEEEIRRIAQGMSTDVSDEDISMVRKHMAAAATAQVEAACLEQFLSETQLSPAQWEKVRDHVIVIHARMTAEEALEAFLSRVADSESHSQQYSSLEAEAERLAAARRDPRVLFAWLNERLTGIRYEKLGEVDEPVAADVYRAP